MKPLRLSFARILASCPPLVATQLTERMYSADRGWKDAYPFRLAARSGSVYSGNTRDNHARFIAVHGYYDWRLLAVARFVCRPGDTVVEVGANVGTETIGYADMVGARGHVYAFEPAPAIADQLRAAIRGAGLSQVDIRQAAVSDAPGHVTFLCAPERESGSGHIGDGPSGAEGSVRVECVTLDQSLSGKGPVRLLAIDAEGAEVGILRGAREMLRRDQPVVVVEAQESHLRRFGFNLAALHAELLGHGYQVYELSRLGLGGVTVGAATQPTRSPMLQTPAGWVRNWVALPPRLADHATTLHRQLVRCGLLPCIRGVSPLAKRLV